MSMQDISTTRKRLDGVILASLGSDITNLLNDPTINEVYVNQDGQLRVESIYGREELPIVLSEEKIKSICASLAGYNDEIIDESHPMLGVQLTTLSLRAQLMYPPIVTKPTFFLRKKPIRIYTLDEYVEQGILSKDHQVFITNAIEEHKNILVIGATGSGKTTFLNAIIHEISKQNPKERILILEDTPELQCASKDVQRLQLPSNKKLDASMQDLVFVSLRLSPERIIVGEVRDQSAYDMLKAWNTGHSGGVSTIHANSTEDALNRLELLAKESNQVSADPKDVRSIIGNTIDIIISIQKIRREEDTIRLVDDVLLIEGYDHHTDSYITKHI